MTHAEVERDLHKWLFSGTSAIAGVYIEAEDQVLTIAEAVDSGEEKKIKFIKFIKNSKGFSLAVPD